MKTCKDTLAHMLEYLDGDVGAELRAKLEAHLDGCQPCEEFLRSYRETPKLCRKALARRMPQEVADKLSALLRQEWSKGTKPSGS